MSGRDSSERLPVSGAREAATTPDESVVRPRAQPPIPVPAPSGPWLAIDQQPDIVAFAMTVPGRIVLFACFGLLLALSFYASDDPSRIRVVPIVLAGAAGAAFWKARRDLAIFLATAAAMLLDPEWFTDARFQDYLNAIAGEQFPARDMLRLLTVALFGAVALALRHVARRPATPFALHPVLCLLGVVSAATAAGVALNALGITSFWIVASIKLLAAYVWFICYAVVDQRSKQRGSLVFALGSMHPFWGSSSTPIGKGSSYLNKLRTTQPEQLARVQLKALKLLTWSLVLQLIYWAITAGCARLGMQPFAEIVRAFARGEAPSVCAGWFAMVVAVTIGALELAIWGHRIVACARLAGFYLRRNTWRPLESRTLADFWNRYYYYFKELLVEFFFYPTFFRFFKQQPRLRTFCATFMAAGVGNAIFHFVRDIDRVLSLGPFTAIEGYTSYAFYCFVLASGIAISQVRSGGTPLENTWSARARSFVCVWGFVVVIHVFGGLEDRTLSFTTRAAFLLHQFGFGS